MILDGQWQKGDFLIQSTATDIEYRINATKDPSENKSV